MRLEGGRVIGVETTKGYIGAKRVGIVVAGNSSRLAAMAGVTPAHRVPRAPGDGERAAQALPAHGGDFGRGAHVHQPDRQG